MQLPLLCIHLLSVSALLSHGQTGLPFCNPHIEPQSLLFGCFIRPTGKSQCIIVCAVLQDVFEVPMCKQMRIVNLKLCLHVILESAVSCSELENDDAHFFKAGDRSYVGVFVAFYRSLSCFSSVYS